MAKLEILNSLWEKRKVNKKGFMRVVEATIAILIILVALVIISSQGVVHEARDFTEILPPLLDEVAQNLTLREEIINNYNESLSEKSIEESLKTRIKNPSLAYFVKICNLSEICYLEPYPADVEENIFACERIIGSSIKNESFEPKKIKVFLWKKSG